MTDDFEYNAEFVHLPQGPFVILAVHNKANGARGAVRVKVDNELRMITQLLGKRETLNEKALKLWRSE